MSFHPDIPMEYRNAIVTGDARDLARRLPDESVDLIFTDPPYPREFLPLYGWLAEEAARVLKPGGLCVALCGHFAIPEVLSSMGRHLDFYWLGGMLHTAGQTARCKRFLCGWKPQVWFSKGAPADHAWVFDLFRATGPDKRFHHWGQTALHAQYYVNKLTHYGQVIWEPFTGGGTVPAVCKQLGRNFIGFEIDPETAALARERVRLTPEPLLVVEPEPLTLPLEVG